MVLGPAHRLHALARRDPARIDVLGDVRRTDEADRRDCGVIEDRIDHFLVAVDDLKDSLGKPRLEKQLGQPHRQRWIAFGGFHDEGVAGGDGRRRHPQRDHAGKVERADPRADPDRLAHRKDVDSRPRPLGVFALEEMGHPAHEFDHVEPALDIALAVGHDLAVLARDEMREFVHVGFDQRLESEHDACAALWIDRRPARLGCRGSLNRKFEHGSIAERDFRLNGADIGIEHVAGASPRTSCASGDEMVDQAHHSLLNSCRPIAGPRKEWQ